MSDTVNEASKALSSGNLVNGFFLIVITFLGIYARIIGGRQNKKEAADLPMILMAHDASKSISAQEEEARKTNTILTDIAKSTAQFNVGQEHTHRLLEDIRNNVELRPRK